MELELDNIVYDVIFNYENITLRNKLNSTLSILKMERLPKKQRRIIELHYDNFLKDIIPSSNINPRNIKGYKYSKALRCLLTPRQINIVISCKNYEAKKNNNFEGFSNITKQYIYDNPKTGKSFIPLELSKFKVPNIPVNITNSNMNVILTPKILIGQWKTLLKHIYNGKYIIIDSKEKLEKYLVFGPLNLKNRNRSLRRYFNNSRNTSSYNNYQSFRNNIMSSNFETNIIYSNTSTSISYRSNINLSDLKYDNKFFNPQYLEEIDIMLIIPSLYKDFTNYFKYSDYSSISRLFVDNCFEPSIININFDKIKYHHIYFITNDYKKLLNNNHNSHSLISTLLKKYYNNKVELIQQYEGFLPNQSVYLSNMLNHLSRKINKYIITPNKSFPTLIPFVKPNIYDINFRINNAMIGENIINLLKKEKYNDIINIFNLSVKNIDNLIKTLENKKLSSSIIERVQETNADCLICLEKVDVPLITSCCYNKICLKCYILSKKESNNCPCCRTKSSLDKQHILECNKISKKQFEIPTITNLLKNSRYKSRDDNLLDIISLNAKDDIFSRKKFIIVFNNKNSIFHVNIFRVIQRIIEFNKYINNYSSIIMDQVLINESLGARTQELLDDFNYTSKYNCMIIRQNIYKKIINSGYNFSDINFTVSLECNTENILKLINSSDRPFDYTHYNLNSLF